MVFHKYSIMHICDRLELKLILCFVSAECLAKTLCFVSAECLAKTLCFVSFQQNVWQKRLVLFMLDTLLTHYTKTYFCVHTIFSEIIVNYLWNDSQIWNYLTMYKFITIHRHWAHTLPFVSDNCDFTMPETAGNNHGCRWLNLTWTATFVWRISCLSHIFFNEL